MGLLLKIVVPNSVITAIINVSAGGMKIAQYIPRYGYV